MVSLDQIHPDKARKFPPEQRVAPGEMMAIPEANKHKEYVCYAEHCLQMAKIATEQGSRIIQREMAAEWLKLADAVPLQEPRIGL